MTSDDDLHSLSSNSQEYIEDSPLSFSLQDQYLTSDKSGSGSGSTITTSNLSTIIQNNPHHHQNESPSISPVNQHYYQQQHQPRHRLNSENSVASSTGSVIIHGRQQSQGELSFDSDCGDASDGSVIFQSGNDTAMFLQPQPQKNNVPLSSLPYPQRRLYWTNRVEEGGIPRDSVSPTRNKHVLNLPRSDHVKNRSGRLNSVPTMNPHPPLPRSRNNSIDLPSNNKHRSRNDSFDQIISNKANNITPPRHRNHYYQSSNDDCPSPIYSSQPYHTIPRKDSHTHENKKSGNSAVLGSLSTQLAKDVAHFFRREKKGHGNNIPRSNSHQHTRSSSGEGLLHVPPSHYRHLSSSSKHISPRFGVGHNRLPSIEHDDWTNEYNNDMVEYPHKPSDENSATVRVKNTKEKKLPVFPDLGIDDRDQGYGIYNSDDLRYSTELDNSYANERTSLLPPPGISSQEDKRKKNKKKKHQRYLSSSSSDGENPYYSREEFDKKLNEEKQKFIMQWKAQMEETQRTRRLEESWFCQMKRLWEYYYSLCCGAWSVNVPKFKDKAESYFNNLPLTMGAIAYSFASLSTVWFKFTEEMLDSCIPVHYHSNQCSFPEYPGCFHCDTSVGYYRLALFFHYSLLTISALMCSNIISKCIVAPRIVVDEMSSPITAAPAGMTCICLVVIFAGRGLIGKLVVCFTAFIHFCILLWFLYMAAAYRILPDPSWYPNTTAIGICAVKTWLYYPLAGHFLMAICLVLCAFFLPISIIRTFISSENKISAPVCWMQMSAPSQALYALTLMAQPSFIEEHPDVTTFETIHRMVYLPFMHFFFLLCMIAAASSLLELGKRWGRLIEKPFSPAHAAFTCPHLTHANAIQAYRSALNAFSRLDPTHPYRRFVSIYWFFWLFLGSILTIIVSTKYLYSLGKWVQPNLEDEEEPPAPNETLMSELISTTGDEMRQTLISPAILQANETGLLVKVHDEYKRTRRIPALGFTPALDWSEMQRERELLLDYVAKNPPRQRKRTLSVPGVDFSYGFSDIDIGTGNEGVYAGNARNRAGTIV